jgi:phospholipase C
MRALWSVAIASSLALGACGSDEVLPGPAEWNRAVTPPSDEDAQARRLGCGYAAGALPAETQGKSAPMGGKIPLDTIVVVMMENRSFDHYFQKLPEAGQPDVEVAPAEWTNPDVDGTPVAPARDTQRCFVDTAHGWNAVHRQWNGGRMDGFVRTNEGEHDGAGNLPMEMFRGTRAMRYYTPEDLPFLFWAATTFAVADHYHASLLGPTWPNRAYLYSGSSWGKIRNEFAQDPSTTLFRELNERQVKWTIYATRLPGFGVLINDYASFPENVRPVDEFFTDAAAGKLPSVVFVDPDLGNERPAANDDHPPSVMSLGQEWLARVADTMMKSPQWSRSALFITYDEHGGLYDHVAPPPACPPDDGHPIELRAGDEQGDFDRYGVRVPMVVISPYAKARFVGHHTYDHTSILRFIQARWTLPAITGRDANAEAPWEMFDFEKPAFKTPPSGLPEVVVDRAQVDACTRLFGAEP